MDLYGSILERADLQASVTARDTLRSLMADRGLETPLYLFGANRDSERWANQLSVQGVIDDFASLPSDFCGFPVVRRADVPLSGLIINCVTNSKPRTAMDQLAHSGHSNSYYASDLQALFPDELEPSQFVIESRESIRVQIDQWQRLHDAFYDEESKSTLKDILAYRISGDPRVMEGYTYRPEEQYFEEFLSLVAEVFVDGGSFDGETSELFAGLYPDFRKIYVFEPDPANFDRAKDRLKEIRDLVFQPVGLSDCADELAFELGSGSASVVSDHGSQKIRVDTIDALAPDATFIKLDLEGWELNALQGAARTILENKPKLAVGAYHAPQHFLSIFEWVMAARSDYKVSMRHYTESWTESVLYFY